MDGMIVNSRLQILDYKFAITNLRCRHPGGRVKLSTSSDISTRGDICHFCTIWFPGWSSCAIGQTNTRLPAGKDVGEISDRGATIKSARSSV
jgi:hypothetical protein